MAKVTRLILAGLWLTIAVNFSASARPFPIGAGTTSPTDPIQALVNSMAHGAWKKISGPSCGSFSSAQPTINRANYDAGSTWASDAAVANAPPAGVGGLYGCNGSAEIFAFSKPVLSIADKFIYMFGGGHTDSGLADFFKFDIRAAANSLSGVWGLLAPGARYLDADTNSRPAGSAQTLDTWPTSGSCPGSPAPNCLYWAATNINGDLMPVACHSYDLNLALNNHIFVPGCIFTFPNANGGSIGSIFGTNTLTGRTSILAQNSNTLDGFVPNHQNNANVAYDAANNIVWVVHADSVDNYVVAKWTSPNSSPSFTDRYVVDSTNVPTDLRLVGPFSDPQNAGDIALFQASSSTAFELINAIPSNGTGGSPVACKGSFSSALSPNGAANEAPGWTYDTTRNFVAYSMGDQHIYKITPSALGCGANWMQTEFTSSPTGDLPAETGNYIKLDYWPAYDIYVLSDSQIWLYRP